MKPIQFLGLKTRSFPSWLQAFNVLCGVTALAILGFGIWHLSTRGQRRAVEGLIAIPEGGGDPTINRGELEKRLEDGPGGFALGEALFSAPEASLLRVLEAAGDTCLPGGLSLASTLTSREGKVLAAARAELAQGLGVEDFFTTDELRVAARNFIERLPKEQATVVMAARGVVTGTPQRRRAAVARLAALQDGRGVPAILAALGAPEGENDTRAAAEAALVELATKNQVQPGLEGTVEERWRAWWEKAQRAYLPPPFDLRVVAKPLLSKVEKPDDASRRDALRGLGIVREPDGAPAAAHLLLAPGDPTVRTLAAWALGRIGGPASVEPLKVALKDPLPLIRVAVARAIGRGRILPLKPEVARLLEDKDDGVRLAAALALLGFLDRSAVAEVDVVAFDDRRSPAERLQAFEALEEAGDGVTSSSRWIAALSDPDEAVRVAAKAALGRRVSKDTVIVGRAAWEKWFQEEFGSTGVRVPLGLGN
jgi:HEAT repeat protein